MKPQKIYQAEFSNIKFITFEMLC